jgi:hypothetical protein
MMKKTMTKGIILLFLLSSLIPVVSSDKLNSNRVVHVDDDIEIKIYAGVNEKTNGNYGLGWVVSVKYNQSESIIGACNITWQTLQGDYIRFLNNTFDLIPNGEIKILGVDWIHFPFPILNLNIKVEVAEIDVSRNGFEIGPFVFFFDGGG